MSKNSENIIAELARLYPDAKPELDYENAFQLLIAAILSAQCTDKRVNIVTEQLFKNYPDAKALAALSPEELEPIIRTCGLYRSKAHNIVMTCRRINDVFCGQVPSTMEELTSLPGVGRKVANVVMSNAFNIPAIAVDTHVFRVSNRLGLVAAKTPNAAEKQLMECIPRDKWSISHHYLIFHGRRVCKAQNPDCINCTLRPMCAHSQKD